MKRRTYASIDNAEGLHAGLTVNASKKKRSLNPLRSDPSQTASLRRAMGAHVKARFARIKSDLIKLIWKDDALGLTENAETLTDNAPKRSKLAERILREAKEAMEAKQDAGSQDAGDNCGVGAGGFQPGNTCAAGGSGSHDVQADVGSITEAFKSHAQSKHNMVHLGDLRDALGWDKERFQAAIKAGRQNGTFVGKIHEGRYKATERDKTERTEDDKLYIGLKLNAEDCPEGECCPHCGARLERDPYSGTCNSCGKEWPVVNAARWGKEPNPKKVEAFQKWLKQQFKNQITSDNERAFWEAYTRRGFEKGAGRSFDDVKGTRWGAGEGEFYEGTKAQFLKDSFAQPVAVDKVKLIAGRSFSDLEGVTEAASTKMVRSLADGLVEGKSPRDIAKDLENDLDGIGRNRALTIARTEIISAHAEGQLIALEQLGVKEVGAMVEWSVTTGPDGEPDDRVCEMCLPLDGMVLSIDEARGMLPRHPNCRCAWIPAKVGEDDEGQKEGGAMRAAIRDSMGKEGEDAESGWAENADFDEHLHKLYDGTDDALADAANVLKHVTPLGFDLAVINATTRSDDE